MTYIHNTFVRDALCLASISQIDTGTANPTGRLEMQDSNSTALVVFTLQNPAFGAVNNGRAVLNPISGAVAVASGTPVKGVFKNRDGVTVMTGSVTVSGAGGDFEATGMDSSITSGSVIIINELAYNAPD